MRKRLSYALVATALVACGSPGSSPGESLASVEQGITGGSDDAGDPAVVVLLQQGGGVTLTTCSGTLIAPRAVVTAAHCLFPSIPTAVHFGATPDDAGATIPVASVHAHPSFDPDTYANDVAVVLLGADAPVEPASWQATPLQATLVGSPIRLVGFGLDASTGGSGRRKRTGTTVVDGETAETITFGADPAMTCFGDSGGAAFATVDGQETLVGVTSTGDPQCAVQGHDTRVDAYASFLLPLVTPAPASASGSAGCAMVNPPGRTPWWAILLVLGTILLRFRSSAKTKPPPG
jgi:secreted trypsin-like serine protease